MNLRRNIFLAATLLLLLAQPQNLFACAACYGDPGSRLAQGLVWGILALLAVVLVVLAGVVSFFVHVGKRSASLSDAPTSASPSESIEKN